jgi:hypothetical protein
MYKGQYSIYVGTNMYRKLRKLYMTVVVPPFFRQLSFGTMTYVDGITTASSRRLQRPNWQFQVGCGAVKFDCQPGQTMLSQSVAAATTLGFPLFARNPSLQRAVTFDRHPGQTTLSPFVGASTTLGYPLIHPKSQPAVGSQI